MFGYPKNDYFRKNIPEAEATEAYLNMEFGIKQAGRSGQVLVMDNYRQNTEVRYF